MRDLLEAVVGFTEVLIVVLVAGIVIHGNGAAETALCGTEAQS
jgi:hypothetical protein